MAGVKEEMVHSENREEKRYMDFTQEYEVLSNGKTSAMPITYIPQDGRDDVVKRIPTTVHASDPRQALEHIRKYFQKQPVDSTAEEI